MSTVTYYENLRIGIQLMGVVEGEKMNVQEVLSLLETFLKLAIQVLLMVISIRDGVSDVNQGLRAFLALVGERWHDQPVIATQEVSVNQFILILKVAPSLCLILIGALIHGLK